MASGGSVLEKKEKRQFMDDYIPLRVVAFTSRILPSYVEYLVKVQRGPSPEDRWDVVHRYSEFSALHEFLETSGITLPIPPKKMFGSKDKEVIAERQKGLQAFLDTVLCEPLLANTWEIKRFLDPTTYSDEPHEAALRNVSMVFRSHPEWTVTEPVRNIGWRFRKHYYLVANRREEKVRYFLTWVEPGPDFALNDKDFESALKLLSSIKHQFILSPVSAIYNGVGVAVMRRFNSKGSLRDVIYNCRPQGHVLKKYGVPCKWRILTVPVVIKFSRQILEGLKFLLDKGFVPAQVHAGNVIIEGPSPAAGVARISDIENTLLGLPSYYHHYLYSYELRKIQTMEAVLSYSFGQLLYEMAMCRPLNAGIMESIPQDMPAALKPVVESLLSKDAVKKPLPTINDLIANEAFDVAIDEREKPVLKVPSRLKEELLKCKSMMESRLQAQQKKIQQQKRLEKAKDAVLSEEEKKKRRKLQKKQMSQQEDTSYASYPTTEIRTDRPPPKATAPAPKRSSKSQLVKQASASQPPTTTSSAAVPKPPPPPAAAPPPPPVASVLPPKTSSERGALLGSIHTFSKTALKKTVTNDRSTPKV